VPGIFACGNVLHVHELVDYVSEEATNAGRHAARHVRSQMPTGERGIPVVASRGVRYTVPQHIDPTRMAEKLVLRFRVDGVYRNRFISVYVDGQRIQHLRRQVMAPGEMEQVVLTRESLKGLQADGSQIRIMLEEE
jgi:hypothetical protein